MRIAGGKAELYVRGGEGKKPVDWGADSNDRD